jgi:hypothetical protein
MAQRRYNLPLDDLINDFGELFEAMFQGGERPCEQIFNVLIIEKNNFDEVA